MFITYLDEGIKCTLSTFAGDTKLSNAVDTYEGRDAIWRDLDQLKLSHWILNRFNNTRCKVLHLYQHRLGDKQVQSSPAKKNLGCVRGWT